MVAPRALARRAAPLAKLPAQGARITARSRSWQQIQRRTYASQGGQSTHKSGSDLPWAIASGVVTIPTLIYLLRQGPLKDRSNDHGDEEHGEHREHGKGDGEAQENIEDDQESGEDNKADSTAEGGTNEGDSGSDGGADKGSSETLPKTSNDNEATTEESSEQEKATPEESSSEGQEGSDGKPQDRPEEGDTGDGDKPDPRKAPGSWNTMSGKQEGISNSDTRHSTDVSHNPDKSTKGEGVAETAKLKGTVDPQRPMK
ncbi:MAG: hypothetical protein LQ351_003273 [Letrouitia transgressa]|nr:MAG: hypothetical protein LQ351_003273 [Letrouitia transgressa]